MSKCVPARQWAANTERLQHQGVGAGPDEPPLSSAPDHAVVEKLLARTAPDSCMDELVRGEHPAAGIHQLQDLDLVHGRIVAPQRC